MSTQYPQLVDAIPITAALQRLFRANVMNDDQLYDYSLAQALRSVFWAVKKGNSTKGRHSCISNSFKDDDVKVQSRGPSESCNAEGCDNAFYVIKELCRSATLSLSYVHTCVYLSLRLLCDEASAYGQGNERPCVTEEWTDALTSFVESTSSAWHVDRRAQLGFLIVASAMLHGVVWCGAYNGANSINEMNDFSNSNKTLQTLTMMHNYNENKNATITASVKHKALFVHFTKLVHDWIHVVLPAMSILASSAASQSTDLVVNVRENSIIKEKILNNISSITTTKKDNKSTLMLKRMERSFRPPLRLVVEANNCIIHCFHALCTDVLHVHASETNTTTSQSTQNICKVLDRELPLELWLSLTHVRDALRRGLGWMKEEIKHHCLECYTNYNEFDESQCATLSESEPEQLVQCMKEKVEEELQKSKESCEEVFDRILRMVNQIVAPLTEISTILEHTMSNMLHEQERLSTMRGEVKRKYGEGAKDYHALTDIMFTHTLHMCVCMREVAWSWMRVSGSILLQNMTFFTNFFTLTRANQHHANKDESILINVAQCLMQLPEVGYSSSSDNEKKETNDSIATTILLSACLTFFISAPLRSAYARIWQSNVDITREIHGLLVQRGLRYRNENVLKLTSLLSDSIMSSSLSSLDEPCSFGQEEEYYNHTSSVFASQLISTSSEQLLDMIATDRDGASETAKKLLCHAILCQPHVIIPSLFRLLSHGSTTARLNVLDVLHALPQLTPGENCTLTDKEYTNVINNSSNNVNPREMKQSANTYNAREKRSREMLRLLAQHLLLHIHDEELCVRMETSHLFDRVAAEDVLEPLLRLYMQTDSTGRKQSVSLASLRSVMAAHNTNAEIILLLLETAYLLTEPANLSNADESKNISQSQNEETDNEQYSSEDVELWTSEMEQTIKRNHVPHTPGEVLPLSLLYAQEENAGYQLGDYDKTSNSENCSNKQETLKSGNATSATNTSSSHSTRSKHVKLNHMVNTLLEHWVKNVKHMTPNLFIAPLLQFLEQKVKSTNEHEVQWHVKYITHLLSLISLYATSSNKGQWNQLEACSAIMSDMLHVFFHANESKNNTTTFSSTTSAISDNGSNTSKANSVVENKTIDNKWCNTLAELCSAEIALQNSSMLVYQLLLPLLCLRACHRELYKILWGQTTQESNSSIQCVCTSLWNGLDISCRCAFFNKHTEIQRVLLEVLTRFPSCVFFNQLAQMEIKSKEMNAQCAFWERVFVFGLCAFLNLIITQSASETNSCSVNKEKDVTNTVLVREEQEQYYRDCKNDFTIVMQQVPKLLELTNKRILPWLASDETTTTATKTITNVDTNNNFNNSSSSSSSNTTNKYETEIDTIEMQKLSCACVDAFALIVYVNLLNPTLPAPFSTNEQNSAGLENIDAFSIRPFTILANTFRSNTVQHDINTTSLSLFQFSVHVQKRLLAILRTQLTSSDAVLQKWWQMYLPLFTELANAACSWLSKHRVDKKQETSQEKHVQTEEFAVIEASTLHIAESCCEILFYAVMASAHTHSTELHNKGNTELSSSTTTTTILHPSSSQITMQQVNNCKVQDVNVESANTHSIFAKLACDDQEALMQFALGTAKYYKLPSVQSIGVKLLSALLAAAPELFVNLSPTQNKKKWNANNALGEFRLWHDALSALASVAHIHPDSATRVLAERVLSTLSNEQ